MIDFRLQCAFDCSTTPSNIVTYRADVDGLRAIAILSVVGFHAFPSWVAGGFIGVDIFFVISGFLISSIVFSALDQGSFNSFEFYSRRIRRIFPALLLVLLVIHALGWFTLNGDDYKQLVKHIAAGAAFIPNIVLWHEASTVATSVETEPLFHLWSLGIEEQFYLAWPLLLIWLWQWRDKHSSSFLGAAMIVGCASFVVCVYTTERNHAAAFFSPLTRFWELMVGAVVAYIMRYRPCYLPLHRNSQSLLGLGLIGLSVVLLDSSKTFPGWWTVLPTLGAYLIIAAGPSAWLNRNVLANKTLVWFGLISFPLYLWHWPLLSFLRIVESDVPARELRISVVFLSIFLAWITYQVIEKPIRFGKSVPAKTVI